MQGLPPNLKITAESIQKELERRKYNKLSEFSLDGYNKHKDFINETSNFRENLFLAGNRTGKSETGAYAVACWATGLYPDWWRGRKFERNVNILVSGETGKLVRDSVQKKLLGEHHDKGSGFIPKSHLIGTRPKAGIPDAVDTVLVQSEYGGESIIQFMSYDQGRQAFQATERDIIWEDEEPPLDVHTESLVRTMTTKGIVILTFTPLLGMSETVMSLMDKAQENSASQVTATWDDGPHLTESDKLELWKSIPPYQRDARSKGIPQLGSGAIYQVPEDDIIVQPFQIPPHWKIAYGMDVGWNWTACAWIAHDVENDVMYLYGEYKKGQAEPAVHASAIKQRGDMTGAIDPASKGRSQSDGKQLITQYRNQGLTLVEADNSVEAGIFEIYERMTTGRFKVFSTCQEWLREYRLYRRDDKGKIVKKDDHLQDATRYCVRTGIKHGKYAGENKSNKKSFKLAYGQQGV